MVCIRTFDQCSKSPEHGSINAGGHRSLTPNGSASLTTTAGNKLKIVGQDPKQADKAFHRFHKAKYASQWCIRICQCYQP